MLAIEECTWTGGFSAVREVYSRTCGFLFIVGDVENFANLLLLTQASKPYGEHERPWALLIHSRTQSKEFRIDLLRFKTHNIQQATFGKTVRKILCEETNESSKYPSINTLRSGSIKFAPQREKPYRETPNPCFSSRERTSPHHKQQEDAIIWTFRVRIRVRVKLLWNLYRPIRYPTAKNREWNPLCYPIATFSHRSSSSLRRFAGRPSRAGEEETSSRRRRRRRSRQGSSHACRSWAAISDQGFVLASLQA